MTKYYSLCVLLFLTISSCTKIDNKEFIIEEATIVDLRSAMVNGDLSCENLVKHYIDRIEKYDQALGINSIVIINPMALSIAKEKDRMISAGESLPPLHGIPVIVKDNYNTIGLQTAAGSLAMKGYKPASDSYIVRKLKEAGAIVLGKSNMAEWAFSPMVTISSLAGETKNPYNTNHVPAGSSGGTAAAVASNFGSVGLGTDTGNSIRGPSSHNALVGFRTTLGLVSRAGIVPLYLRNDVGGPMCRTVEDACRILDIIAGYDPDDELTLMSEGKIPESYMDFLDKDGLKGTRIGVLSDLSEKDIHPEIRELFYQAIEDLRSLGAEVIDNVYIDNFDTLSSGHWAPAFQYDLNKYLSEQEEEVPVKNLQEVFDAGNYASYIEDNLKYHLRFKNNPEERFPPALNAYKDPGRIKYRKAIEDKMNELGLDAFIYPSWNFPPARIGHKEEYRGDNNQIVSPHTGQPAFTIPMGYLSGDLPGGLQFLGRSFDEATLIKLSYSYEQGTRHRKEPAILSSN